MRPATRSRLRSVDPATAGNVLMVHDSYAQHSLWAERRTVSNPPTRERNLWLRGRHRSRLERTLAYIGSENNGLAWLDKLAEAGRYATDLF